MFIAIDDNINVEGDFAAERDAHAVLFFRTMQDIWPHPAPWENAAVVATMTRHVEKIQVHNSVLKIATRSPMLPPQCL